MLVRAFWCGPQDWLTLVSLLSVAYFSHYVMLIVCIIMTHSWKPSVKAFARDRAKKFDTMIETALDCFSLYSFVPFGGCKISMFWSDLPGSPATPMILFVRPNLETSCWQKSCSLLAGGRSLNQEMEEGGRSLPVHFPSSQAVQVPSSVGRFLSVHTDSKMVRKQTN